MRSIIDANVNPQTRRKFIKLNQEVIYYNFKILFFLNFALYTVSKNYWQCLMQITFLEFEIKTAQNNILRIIFKNVKLYCMTAFLLKKPFS